MSTPTTPVTPTQTTLNSASQETSPVSALQSSTELVNLPQPSADTTTNAGALPPPFADSTTTEVSAHPHPPADTPPAMIATPTPAAAASETQETSPDPMRIPKEVEALLPPLTEHIPSLLRYNLPELVGLASERVPPAKTCISDEDVCWSLEALGTAPTPSAKWLGDLGVLVDRRVREGQVKFSLRHPTVPDLRLPPWGMAFWRYALEARTEMDRWADAQKWMRDEAAKGTEFTGVQELIARTPWSMRVWAIDAGTSTISLLSVFLSTKWLAERHFDLFATYFTTLIGERADEWWIGGTYLAALLKELPKNAKRSAQNRGGLFDFQVIVTKKAYKHLLFPANLNGNHWIAVSVDVEQKVFRFGMSFCIPTPTADTHGSPPWG